MASNSSFLKHFLHKACGSSAQVENFEPVDLTILDLHQRVTAAHPELRDIPATTAHGSPRAQAQDVDPVDLADTTDLAAIEVATEAD